MKAATNYIHLLVFVCEDETVTGGAALAQTVSVPRLVDETVD